MFCSTSAKPSSPRSSLRCNRFIRPKDGRFQRSRSSPVTEAIGRKVPVSAFRSSLRPGGWNGRFRDCAIPDRTTALKAQSRRPAVAISRYAARIHRSTVARPQGAVSKANPKAQDRLKRPTRRPSGLRPPEHSDEHCASDRQGARRERLNRTTG